MYVGFGIILYVAVMLLRFYRCQDLTNPKLEKVKEKFLYEVLSKHNGFASQEFLVVRGNG